MNINDIIVPEYMAKPNEKKYQKAKKYYKTHKSLDYPIVVDQKGILRDGYARFLALKECGYNGDIADIQVDCKFAYCVHEGCDKIYTWKIRNSIAKRVHAGDQLIVPCGKNNKKTIVTIVEISNKVPNTNWPIKNAKEIYKGKV